MSYAEPTEQMTSAERSQMHRLTEMEKRYDLIMPINGEYNPAMCRDKFLQQLFDELNLESTHTKSSTRSSTRSDYTCTRALSISTFLGHAPKIIKKTVSLDNVTERDLEAHPYRLTVLTGQKDVLYAELLESIKRSSLFLMFARVIKRLRIMQGFAVEYSGIKHNELPHKLFKWSMDGFFNRCRLPDDVYIDVLLRNHTTEELDWAKFSTDLLETLRYYKYFYTEIYMNHGYQKILSILWDQQQLLHIGEKLDNTLKVSIKTLYDINKQDLSFRRNFFGLTGRDMVKNCQRRYMEATWRSPIEWRYVRDYYASLVEMQCLKDNIPVVKLEEQIKEQQELIKKDNTATRNSICVFDYLIEKYQSRLQTLSTSFSEDLEHWELQIVIAKTRLAKARDDYREAVDKIDYMRRRIEEVKEIIEAERLAELEELGKPTMVPNRRKLTKPIKTKSNEKTARVAKSARGTVFRKTISNPLAMNEAS